MTRERLPDFVNSDFITAVYDVLITNIALVKRGRYQDGSLFNRLKKNDMEGVTISEDLSRLGDNYKLESQNKTKR